MGACRAWQTIATSHRPPYRFATARGVPMGTIQTYPEVIARG